MSTLAAARAALLARRSDLVSREGRVAARLRNTDEPLPADSGDQAQVLEDEEVLQDLETSERAELEQIDAALRRVDEGTWGICTQCGGAIDPRRLAALPSAALCLECAS